MSALSFSQQVDALDLVAAWLGPWLRDDGMPCPVGDKPAVRGLGPTLRSAWDWPDTPTPTIILEGGPDGWTYRVSEQLRDRFAEIGIHTEPWSSYALCLYPIRVTEGSVPS